MTTTPISGAPAGPATAPSAATGTIARLNAFDGLFLRAEHLDRMQAYTRELARALGRAGGRGVVHGYGVSVADATLTVTSGLAIDPAGRPLLTTSSIDRPLGELTTDNDGMWVIELLAAEEPFGDEAVYGALCDDPCEPGGASTRPYVAEGVGVALRRVRLPGVDGSPAIERRSRAASAWFEQERQQGDSLLPTSQRDPTTIADFAPASWTEPTGLPDGDGVPVGVLLRIAGTWEVDAWTARRDRVDPPPRRAWEGRLGMRPWDVFLAQVLQFQVQLASHWPQASLALLGLADTRLAISELDEAAGELRQRRTRRASELVSSAVARLQGRVAPARSGRGLLADNGFVELPPAGYLPLAGGELPLELEVASMFPPHVDLRFCTCRPDAVAHAVEEAQHLDRVQLTDTDVRAAVDILVPGGERPSEEGGLTTAHNWVAFVRNHDLACDQVQVEPDRDLVDVYRYQVGAEEELGGVVDSLASGDLPDPTPGVTASYPVDGWALPEPAVQQAVRAWVSGMSEVAVVGIATVPERRPLAGVRAALLVTTFEAAAPVQTVRTGVVATLPREAAYVVVRQGLT